MTAASRLDFAVLERTGGLGRLRLPEFLGIGMPQGGSTWLHLLLDDHPGTFMPRRKELHYWDRQPFRGVRHYSRWFRDAPPDARLGEVTPGYARLPIDRLRQLHRALPGVRAIYVVRNPVDRDWSAARRKLGRQIGSRDLSGVTEREWHQIIDRRDPETFASMASVHIETWHQVVEPEQLLVVPFDDLQDDPAGLARSVFAHIGVDVDHEPDPALLRKKANENPSAVMPASVRARLAEAYADEIARMAGVLGRDLTHWYGE